MGNRDPVAKVIFNDSGSRLLQVLIPADLKTSVRADAKREYCSMGRYTAMALSRRLKHTPHQINRRDSKFYRDIKDKNLKSLSVHIPADLYERSINRAYTEGYSLVRFVIEALEENGS